VRNQRILECALVGVFAHAEEIEAIGIFQVLPCQVGLGFGQVLRKIGKSLAPAR
jgi:hypothetical protein